MLPISAAVYISIAGIKDDRLTPKPIRSRAQICKAYIAKLLIPLVLTVVQAGATTIIIVRTATGFVVAADSRLTDSSGEPLPTMVCKVFENRECVIWGFGGLHEQGTFRPTDILAPLIGGADLRESLAKINGTLIPALTEQAKQLKIVAPAKYIKLLGGDDIFEVFMVTTQEAIVQGYLVTEDVFGITAVQPSAMIDCKGGPSCGHGRIIEIGQKNEIARFLAAHAMAVAQIPSDTDRARFLVQLEADVDPKTVAPPFSVVEIDPDGVHWVDPHDHCITQDANSRCNANKLNPRPTKPQPH